MFLPFLSEVVKNFPTVYYFDNFNSILPDQIDIQALENKDDKTPGRVVAQNFLYIADISTAEIKKVNGRFLQSKIDAINKKITKEFREFWNQKIGRSSQIEIEMQVKHHSSTVNGKSGLPYIEFWIRDQSNILYPRQRSAGVKWFLSFFIQLLALWKDSGSKYLLLIDEPGASLHAVAQKDVLRVIEQIGSKVQVIYTTHSPYLIQIEKLYRTVAVQRKNTNDDNSETVVLSTRQLSTASRDTLTPIYSIAGSGLAEQQVIKQKNNVLLEEISAYYYVKAFLKLMPISKTIHLLPGTGVTNIPWLSYLFVGWDIDFLVIVDDEANGRKVFNELKQNLFGNDEEASRSKLIKLKGKTGIEDVFSKADFRKHIVEDCENEKVQNSESMKGRAKVLPAIEFYKKVEKGELNADDFDDETRKEIKSLLSEIESRLI